ncbi:hypothetical protein [Streptomyces sp. NPDC093707]|uniref:hypothetical protein n=1 Tax=Streptomyces sp. NPDC093707 TaxID=3154984 RepID=UPI00344C2EB9
MPLLAVGWNAQCGEERVGIEVERVLVRLAESGGREYAALDEAATLEAVGALAIVDPARAGCDAESLRGAVAG